MSPPYDAAREAWPGVDVPPEAFAEAVRARAGDDPDAPLAFADLYLALACARGDAAALAAVEQRCFPVVRRALARLRVDDARAEEILQRVRARVFVGDGGPPKIASFSARGSLLAWLRAVAVHEALTQMRDDARRPAHDGPSALERLPVRHAPDLEHLRRVYAEPFKVSLSEALASLDARERNVLRLVYLDGLTADQVGQVYGVHRVSVARWLGQIRETLFRRTRERLATRVRLGATDMESIARMCLSEIDVSLERLL